MQLSGRSLHQPPGEQRSLPSFLLALLMHLLLVMVLYVGVQWQSSPPGGAEAELWDEAMVDDATPPPPPPKVVAPVVPPVAPTPQEDPEIALRAERKKRQAQAALEQAAVLRKQESQAQAALEQAAELRKQELQAQAEQKKQQAQKLQDAKELAEKKKQQIAKEQEQKERAQAKQRLKEQERDKLATLEKEKAAKGRLEKDRQEQLARLRGAAGDGGSGGTAGADIGGTGNASPGYPDRIRRRVIPFIEYRGAPGDGSQVAKILVKLAPDGEVLSRRLMTSSGLPEWDQAVLTAIDAASPLPRDADGTIPRQVLRDGVLIKFQLRRP